MVTQTNKHDRPALEVVHAKYEELQSLEKTCDWLAEEHNWHLNRQKLSRLFKGEGFHVSPPNGWPDIHWEDSTSHLDPIGKFAAEMIRVAFDDITDPNVRVIDFLSACYFLASDFYKLCLSTVMRNVRFSSIDETSFPAGIDLDRVIRGREIYERNRSFWLP